MFDRVFTRVRATVRCQSLSDCWFRFNLEKAKVHLPPLFPPAPPVEREKSFSRLVGARVSVTRDRVGIWRAEYFRVSRLYHKKFFRDKHIEWELKSINKLALLEILLSSINLCLQLNKRFHLKNKNNTLVFNNINF